MFMELRMPTPIHIISTNYEIVINTPPHQMAKTGLVPSKDVLKEIFSCSYALRV